MTYNQAPWRVHHNELSLKRGGDRADFGSRLDGQPGSWGRAGALIWRAPLRS